MRLRHLLVLPLALASLALAQTTITLDASGPGRTFDGLGAVSAGASSRLLYDYPEPQRSQVLDYLFKPHYGAALQHLKVEIGSDVNSTDGSEPSHMRSRTDHDYTRGYEWWLMREARKRNPHIILDTLAWGAPGWIGNGTYYSHDMAEYVADFLNGAKKQGLDIQYTGAWNERKPDYAWVKLLRKVLDERGLSSVKIVCCDMVSRAHPFEPSDKMSEDPQLAKAIAAIGVHYPSCNKEGFATQKAIDSGHVLWSAEDQPNCGAGPFIQREWAAGGRIMAHRYNDNYLKGRLTKTEIWSPVTSYYDSLAAPHSGLMYANTPWSGHYNVQSTIWVTAHTTQFAQPGWKYLDNASAYLPNNGGSYVTLRAPEVKGHAAAWSIVLETTPAKSPQKIAFNVGKGLATTPVYVWQTNGKRTFERVATLPVRNGKVEYTFEPDSIYTLTTTTGQAKGTAQPPADKPFPFPYRDSFNTTPLNRAAKYLSDQNGAFEAHACAGRAGRCLEQVITQKPIPWLRQPEPFTLAGDAAWQDYTLRADMMLPEAGSLLLIGRIDSADIFQDKVSIYPAGYLFRLESTGAWKLLSTQFKQPVRVLAEGNIAAPGKTWHRGEMRFAGDNISVLLDGKQIASVHNSDHTHGQIALGSGWNHAQFDNLSVTK
ncbi:MAG: galactosylceramidase [Acidobacteria bacterium]|nr:galactosylceramidase [Acidobacteriota bacterium]